MAVMCEEDRMTISRLVLCLESEVKSNVRWVIIRQIAREVRMNIVIKYASKPLTKVR